MNEEKLYLIRDYIPGDKNFILSTFLRGMYYGDSWFSLIPKKIFMDNYKKVAETLINNSIIKIACLSDDKDVILGYSILSKDYLGIHFCYVKSAWRRKGIGKSLLPKFPIYISHFTKLGLSLRNKYPNTVFNPFKLT